MSSYWTCVMCEVRHRDTDLRVGLLNITLSIRWTHTNIFLPYIQQTHLISHWKIHLYLLLLVLFIFQKINRPSYRDHVALGFNNTKCICAKHMLTHTYSHIHCGSWKLFFFLFCIFIQHIFSRLYANILQNAWTFTIHNNGEIQVKYTYGVCSLV